MIINPISIVQSEWLAIEYLFYSVFRHPSSIKVPRCVSQNIFWCVLVKLGHKKVTNQNKQINQVPWLQKSYQSKIKNQTRLKWFWEKSEQLIAEVRIQRSAKGCRKFSSSNNLFTLKTFVIEKMQLMAEMRAQRK